MMLRRKVVPTEEVGFRILEALKQEMALGPKDLHTRTSMEELAKKLMKCYRWNMFDFGRGWSLVIDEKLIDGCKDHGRFYAWPTPAGREFVTRTRKERRWMVLPPKWYYFWTAVFGVAVMGITREPVTGFYLAIFCAAMFVPFRRPGV